MVQLVQYFPKMNCDCAPDMLMVHVHNNVALLQWLWCSLSTDLHCSKRTTTFTFHDNFGRWDKQNASEHVQLHRKGEMSVTANLMKPAENINMMMIDVVTFIELMFASFLAQ